MSETQCTKPILIGSASFATQGLRRQNNRTSGSERITVYLEVTFFSAAIIAKSNCGFYATLRKTGLWGLWGCHQQCFTLTDFRCWVRRWRRFRVEFEAERSQREGLIAAHAAGFIFRLEVSVPQACAVGLPTFARCAGGVRAQTAEETCDPS